MRAITSLLALILASNFAAAADSEREIVTGITLTRVGRIQSGSHGSKLPVDIRDREVRSPKSVRFSADGKKIYINSLEGSQTLVYSFPEYKKLKTITHIFGAEDAHLFQGETTVFDYPYFQKKSDVNQFNGKPVESELSADGRYLWIPYYRRGFDSSGQSPSAVAIVDTESDEIVRVMPTGPIPKYVTASPDGRYVAIVHWGDNTIGLIDTSSGDPRNYKYVAHLIVENQMSQKGLGGEDRDQACGFCLRGTIFTPDSRYLLVARMGGGGLAGFDIEKREYLGSLMGIASTPRHLVLSPDGEIVYASSNVSGILSRLPTAKVVDALLAANGKRIRGPKWDEVYVGKGARTLDITKDGQILFVAVNNTAELVSVSAEAFKVMARITIDKFAVGLAVSPDSNTVLLTSQGRNGVGGNTVNIVSVSMTKSKISEKLK